MRYSVPNPRQQRTRNVRTALIVVGIIFVLCFGSGVLMFKSVQNAVGPAADTANTFLSHLAAGETDTAYENLCTATRDEFTAEQFAEVVNHRPKITEYSIISTNVMNWNGRVSASVAAELYYADGSTEEHVFQLGKEDGVWKVCGQPY